MSPVDSLRTETKFKQTEIGAIPVDWELVKLKHIISLNYGEGLPDSKRKGNQYPVYGSNGIIGYHNDFLVKAPGIIIGRKGTVGTVTWAEENFWPIDTTYYVVQNSEKTDLRWLYYQLTAAKLYSLNAATGVPGLNREVALSHLTPLPPIHEQKKIADILGSVDEAIEKKREIIEKTKELKKGLMQELLTHGIGHAKFKKTEIGEIPVDWQLVQVRDVSRKPEYGYTASAIEKPAGPKFLRITDIQDGHVNWSAVPYCDCPDSIKKKFILRSGDILFARTGATTGKSFLIQDCPEAVFASYLIRITPTAKISSQFLNFVFNSHIYWKQIKQTLSGSAQGGVNATFLSKIKIPLPPGVEQEFIATILSKTDKIIEKELRQETALANMKKGLMESLLTGKIRISMK